MYDDVRRVYGAVGLRYLLFIIYNRELGSEVSGGCILYFIFFMFES